MRRLRRSLYNARSLSTIQGRDCIRRTYAMKRNCHSAGNEAIVLDQLGMRAAAILGSPIVTQPKRSPVKVCDFEKVLTKIVCCKTSGAAKVTMRAWSSFGVAVPI